MHHTSVLGLKYEIRLTEPQATGGLDAPDPHFGSDSLSSLPYTGMFRDVGAVQLICQSETTPRRAWASTPVLGRVSLAMLPYLASPIQLFIYLLGRSDRVRSMAVYFSVLEYFDRLGIKGMLPPAVKLQRPSISPRSSSLVII